jgi:hypothetical protein
MAMKTLTMLDHARRQLVTLRSSAIALLVDCTSSTSSWRLGLADDEADLVHEHRPPAAAGPRHAAKSSSVERVGGDLAPSWRSADLAVGRGDVLLTGLAGEQGLDLRVADLDDDPLLVLGVLADASISSLLDGQLARVLVDALAGEDLDADDHALDARGHFSEASRTSPAFSPKIARSSFSSGVSSVSPLGVTLPTRIVACLTWAPM